MERRKKVTLVAVILSIGVGIAFLFRRPAADDKAAETAPTDRPFVAGNAWRPPAEPAARPGEGARFFGTIEPAGDKMIEPAGDKTATSAATQPPGPSVAEAPPVAETNKLVHAADVTVPWSTTPFTPPSEAGPAPRKERLESDPVGWATVKSRPEPLPAGADNLLEKRPPINVARQPVRKHKIVDGDTLARLAEKYLGRSDRALDLYEYNRDVLAGPDLLPIDREIRIPPDDYQRPAPAAEQPRLPLSPIVAPPAQAKAAGTNMTAISAAAPPSMAKTPAGPTYVVQPYDTLPLIARKLYGDLQAEQVLLAANRDRLKTPKDLRPGMTLLAPGAVKK